MSPLERLRALAEAHARAIAEAPTERVAIVAADALVELTERLEIVGLKPYTDGWAQCTGVLLEAARQCGIDDVVAAAQEARRALREREKAEEAALIRKCEAELIALLAT